MIEEPIELHCLGGFVVTLLYGLKRSTADVDVISVIPRYTASELLKIAGEGAPLHRKHGVYLDVVGIATVPENYDERLTEIFSDEFENLRLFALDPYDIALAKIEPISRETAMMSNILRELHRLILKF